MGDGSGQLANDLHLLRTLKPVVVQLQLLRILNDLLVIARDFAAQNNDKGHDEEQDPHFQYTI